MVERIWIAGSELGNIGYIVDAIVCASDDCKKLSLSFQLRTLVETRDSFRLPEVINEWQLLPESSAKPQPSYIPEAITSDYYEACRIRNLSPKASATLSRRCLQGMIRDFCGITKKRLVDEIDALRKQMETGIAARGVQEDTIDAIDHVRSIGNIGAHMEADINHIVDVDPDEAQKLIDLLELLLDEWYVARNAREQKLKAIGVVAAEKAQSKLAAPLKQLAPPNGETGD
jgi:Domain of unknown function (DUF4145)